jgi:tellurite resistance protein TerC
MSRVTETEWIGFAIVVGVLLILDLAVFNRRSHVPTLRESAIWSGSLVGVALLFGCGVLALGGVRAGLEYYTGYLIELSLSVDNLFVFLLIFDYFAVPGSLQPRVLKWGIFGAMAMRGVMILAGVLLLERFSWIIYVFGGVLVLTGWKMWGEQEIHLEPERNPLVRLARRFLPMSDSYDGQRFFTRQARRVVATPLFLVLLVVEWCDLVFAIDSIPAIFAVTRDPFIVYSSNVFAVLGLRALFFVLAGAIDRFRYLKPAVALILVFVGLKMVLSHWIHVPIGVSLGVVLGALAVAVLLSLWRERRVSDSPSA